MNKQMLRLPADRARKRKQPAAMTARAAAPDAPPRDATGVPAAGYCSGGHTAPAIDEEVRRTLIAHAAYFRAERRGFAPGHALEDWLCAESEVDAAIARREVAGRSVEQAS